MSKPEMSTHPPDPADLVMAEAIARLDRVICACGHTTGEHFQGPTTSCLHRIGHPRTGVRCDCRAFRPVAFVIQRMGSDE